MTIPLEFEPIHRVVFGADPDAPDALSASIRMQPDGPSEGHQLTWVAGDQEGTVSVLSPPPSYLWAPLQRLTSTSAPHPEVWHYIHGADVVRSLAAQPNTVGFCPPWARRNCSPR